MKRDTSNLGDLRNLMNEFAFVLTEIVKAGRAEGRLSVKLLAERMGITPSYLSNMKQARRGPPGRKSLLKLLRVLRELNTSAEDVQRLEEAYRRVQLGTQGADPLATLLNEQLDANSLALQIAADRALADELASRQSTDYSEVVSLAQTERSAWLDATIHLLELGIMAGDRAGDILVTWFHHHTDDVELRTRLIALLRAYLAVPSDRRVIFLWRSGSLRDFGSVLTFIESFIGTDRCELHEIADNGLLPDQLVMEGVGYVEARPSCDETIWLRQAVIGIHEGAAAEVSAAKSYLTHQGGIKSGHHPLVRTATMTNFQSESWSRTLAGAEHVAQERILLRPTFSYASFPASAIALRMTNRQIPEPSREAYLAIHERRRSGLKRRSLQGRDLGLYSRVALAREFRQTLAAEDPAEAEAHRLQLCDVMSSLGRGPGFQMGLTGDDDCGHFSVTGDLAFLAAVLDPGSHQDGPPGKPPDMVQVMAVTGHPEMIYRLRAGLIARWEELPTGWRTDTDPGRRQVVGFLLAEALKAMLEAEVATADFGRFVSQLIDAVPSSITDPFHPDIADIIMSAKRRRLPTDPEGFMFLIEILDDAWVQAHNPKMSLDKGFLIHDPDLVQALDARFDGRS